MAKKDQTSFFPGVAPKNAKEIAAAAKNVISASERKAKAAEQESAAKDKLLNLVKKANLKPVDGKIKFETEGLMITITPREDNVNVKESKEGGE